MADVTPSTVDLQTFLAAAAPPSRRRTEFGLNDSVTSFRVASDAFSGNGALGAGTVTIDSVEPFYLEPKLPLHVTVGDRIDLPLGIVNATSTPMHDVAVSIRTPKGVARGGDEPTAQIAANGRVRQMLPLLIREAGGGEISIAAHASGYSDKVIRTLTVHPRGLERLIQEPCGCFEQTSSTTYPLVMAQRYFKSHQGVDPKLIARSEDVLARGRSIPPCSNALVPGCSRSEMETVAMPARPTHSTPG